MTPANPDNNKPFIYRIADALGITHLVVAVQHSHLMSEIEGLVSAIAGKMDAKTIDSVPANNADHLVSSKGVYDALMAINNLRSITSYGLAFVHAEAGNNPLVQIALQRTGETLVDAKISLANIANLNRALLNPDSTPTADSDNLVTSGGVKAALDAKHSINQVDENDEQEAHLSAIAEDDDIYFDFRLKNGNTQKEVLLPISKMDNFARAISNPDTTPTANSTNLVTSGGVKAALNQKADTLAMNNALAGKAPLTDTQVLYMAIEEDGDKVTEIDVDALFTSGNTQVSLLIESLATSKVKLENVFTSAGRAFTFLTDLVEIPVGAVISCRIILSDEPSTNTKYFVVIDGIWVPQS